MHNTEKIPIPAHLKWKEFRIRILPFIVFLGVASVVAWLWKEQTDAATMTGRVVGVQAEVRSPQPGLVSEVLVQPFDFIATGDPIGRVITTDPKIIEAELAVVLAEIELIRITRDPLSGQQRNLINYESMHIDLMENRARLGIAEIRREEARREYERLARLLENNLTSQEMYDRAETEFSALKKEAEVISTLVERLEQRLDDLNLEDVFEQWKQEDPTLAAIEVQRRRIDQIKAEMMPVVLYAPIGGQISNVFKSNGEYVERGDTILQIRTANPDYILAYVRHPAHVMPEPGTEVLVRKQGRDRIQATMYISEVGVHMETEEQLAGLFPNQPYETIGIPVRVEISEDIGLMPGERVEMRLKY
ncbi:hypothetical protein QLX67_04045 [Balneolaceae bacterium ANBcel3]|nr:hypothetical protein [Balneolaceae bacterium ANBcel3]